MPLEGPHRSEPPIAHRGVPQGQGKAPQFLEE